MAREIVPHELIEALKEYLDRHPKNKEITISDGCGNSIKMKDMSLEI